MSFFLGLLLGVNLTMLVWAFKHDQAYNEEYARLLKQKEDMKNVK